MAAGSAPRFAVAVPPHRRRDHLVARLPPPRTPPAVHRVRGAADTALAGFVVVIAVAGAACSGSSPPPAAPQATPAPTRASQPRPARVPAAARQIVSDLSLGSPSAQGVAPAALHIFYSMRCVDGLIEIATTRESIYAELPCDRSPPDSEVRRFLANPAKIRVVAGSSAKLFIESQIAGSLEFTVGGVWIEPH